MYLQVEPEEEVIERRSNEPVPNQVEPVSLILTLC